MGKRLQGRVAVVTGAGRGIGRGIAALMAEEGAAVVVNDPGTGVDGTSSDPSPADQVVAEIRQAGGTAIANYDSVADYRAAENIVATATAQFGRLDILVNNAGILRDRMIFNMSEEELDAVVRGSSQGHLQLQSPRFASSCASRRRDASSACRRPPVCTATPDRRTTAPRKTASRASPASSRATSAATASPSTPSPRRRRRA